MSIIQGNVLSGATYQISNSLRFRSNASACLSRSFSTPTSSSVFTYSVFVKRGSLGVTSRLFGASTTTYLTFNSSDQINLTLNGVSAATSTAVFRDPAAHYHIVYQQNGASQTIWVNNVVVATGTTAAAIFNTAIVHQIGAANTANFFDGYLSEINFIDGQALTSSSFGEFSSEYGQWVPKKYTGTYGTNGFYLPFNDGSNLTNLCLDRSGNANNWTATNVSLSAGAMYDWMLDTPTNNYAVLNPLAGGNGKSVMGNGNLTATSSVGGSFPDGAYSSIPASGIKVYAEITPETGEVLAGGMIGIVKTDLSTSHWYCGTNGNKYTGVVNTGAYGSTYSNGNIIGISLDLLAGTLSFSKDNVPQGTAFSGLSGEWFIAVCDSSSGETQLVANANFGQRPFAYTPPSGFKSLCTANLPAPTIVNPKQHFDTVLATGANIKTATEAVFHSNFFEWIKDRANVNNHQLIDTVRGSSSVIQSNTTGVETTYITPSGSSVGWVWKAGGTAVSNNAGSITSQVSANTLSGFSVVTYTGTGANATVGHGLGVAPKMIIVKNRNRSVDWLVWHTRITATQFLNLNTTIGAISSAAAWNNTDPTSSVFSVGTGQSVNGSSNTHVAYCFTEVPGFSKIGSYIGNGSSDGPFVYCGFKPRFVLIKRVDSSASDWVIFDSARNSSNLTNLGLLADLSNSEFTGASTAVDLLSNGFKPKGAGLEVNVSSASYIFYAIAESPFNYSTAR